MKFEKYQHFNTEDFLEDEHFRHWVLSPDSATDVFWQQFLHTFPEQETSLSQAKNLVLSLHGHFHSEVAKVPAAQVQASLRLVATKIGQPGQVVAMPKRRFLQWGVAASILFLLGIGSLYFLTKDIPAQVYTTGNGERLTLQLPDASTVEMNANSILKFYPEKWQDGQLREVWLKGEAYFSVEKKTTATKFLVNAGDVKIAVLGTQFNVRERDDKAEVVLAEGKIELNIANAQKVMMKPGDYVAYSKKERKVDAKKVNASDYYAWKDGMAVFNNTLSGVARELEILYGIEFIIENDELKDRQIQLSAPADSLDKVLETMQLLYPDEITVKRQNGRVVIF